LLNEFGIPVKGCYRNEDLSTPNKEAIWGPTRSQRMHKREDYANRLELLQGTLDLTILQTLQWGPQHGYGISQAIKASSNELLLVDTGSLYPALHRLEKQKLVKSEWDISENKQRAKYYRLTPSGKKQLLKEQSRWEQFVDAMASLMKPRKGET
jgi:PadR family transcriptional regulator